MSNCNNANSPFNVRLVLPPGITPDTDGNDLEIRGISPIKVVERMEGKKRVFIISYFPPTPPSCSVTVTPTKVELGIPVSLTYKVSTKEGSSPIVDKVLTPQVDLNDAGEVVVSKTFMIPGRQGLQKVEITDEEGQTSSCQADVLVEYRFYAGTIPRNNDSLSLQTILSSEFASSLGSSIGEAFPRREYNMNKSPQGHFVWLYPAMLNSIPTPTGDGNFPFQLTVLPGVWTINGIDYKAAKTSTFFTNNGKATLGF